MLPKFIINYPQNLIDLALHGCNRKVVLNFPTAKAANHLRFTLYGLRRAIRHEGVESKFRDFMRAVLRIQGTSLIITPPESTDIANLLQDALEKAGLSSKQTKSL